MAILIRFTSSLGYAERMVEHVKGETEQWLADHHEANDCCLLETMIANVNTVMDMAMEMDTVLHTAYCEGKEFDPNIERHMKKVLEIFVRAAESLDSAAARHEAGGFTVEGVEKLRETLGEVRAMLDPSDDVNSDAEADAIAAHRRGESVEWPEEQPDGD